MEFVSDYYQVSEGDGELNICVRRYHGTDRTYTVLVSAIPGSAQGVCCIKHCLLQAKQDITCVQVTVCYPISSVYLVDMYNDTTAMYSALMARCVLFSSSNKFIML